MSENIDTNDAETAEGIGRRALLGGGAALIAAVAGASVAGVHSAAAEETPPSSGEGPTPPNHTEGPSAVQLERMKAMQDWARSLALQGATFATPIVAMYLLRSTVAFGPSAKAAPGTIWNFDQIATPTIAAETGYVSPNVNVLYGFGFADLGQEPYILTAPDSDGRYYMIELVDMWTNAFAYPAGGASGYKGGKFALVGPGWQGELPADVKRIDSATCWLELQPRVYVRMKRTCRAPAPSCTASSLRPCRPIRAPRRPRPRTTTKSRRSIRRSRLARWRSRIRCSSGRSSPPR